jgi:PAS domain-containing protein
LLCFAFLLRALYVQFRNLSASQSSLAERESKLNEQSRELARANTQIDAALNNMSQGLCMFDKAGQLVICNERYLGMYHVPAGAAEPGSRFVDLLECQKGAGNFTGDPERFAEDLCAQLAQGQKVNTTIQLADGRIIDVANEPMIGGGWVATHDDITERQRSEARIARMARHDALTDLANRVLFRERADEALERYKSTGVGYSVLIFDLDLFNRSTIRWAIQPATHCSKRWQSACRTSSANRIPSAASAATSSRSCISPNSTSARGQRCLPIACWT